MELKKENKSFSSFTEDIEKVTFCSLAFSLICVQQRQNRARAVLHPQQKRSETPPVAQSWAPGAMPNAP